MIISLLSWIFAAHAVQNLNCELALTDHLIAAGRAPIRLDENQIVVRGRLEWELDPADGRARWLVRDVEGFERVFANPSDSLYPLVRDDLLLILNEDGTVFREGRFETIAREHWMPYEGRSISIGPIPQIFATATLERPLLGHQTFCEFFGERRAAVLVKRCGDADLRRLRHRLNPQIAAYEIHQRDDGRFVDLGQRRLPFEVMVFHRKLDGPLHPNFVDAEGRVEGVRADKMKNHPYRLVLSISHQRRLEELRRLDRIFLLDAAGEQLLEYTPLKYPIEIINPPRLKLERELMVALASTARAVVVRRVWP